jgi:hypothetical protein
LLDILAISKQEGLGMRLAHQARRQLRNMGAYMRMIVPSLLASLLLVSSWPSRANDLGLVAMVPDHVGFTMQKSPVLYFLISHTTSLPIRFTLIDNRMGSPAAEVFLKSPTRPGLLAIRLEDYHVILEEELEYRWYVSVIQSPDLSRYDNVAGGSIQRVNQSLVDYYGRSCDKNAVRLLREADIWYDAFACVTELIETNPQDRTLRDFRGELLGQKNLIYFP